MLKLLKRLAFGAVGGRDLRRGVILAFLQARSAYAHALYGRNVSLIHRRCDGSKLKLGLPNGPPNGGINGWPNGWPNGGSGSAVPVTVTLSATAIGKTPSRGCGDRTACTLTFSSGSMLGTLTC